MASWSVKARHYLELGRFSHTLFALPFALMALVLATPGEWPALRTTAWILVCMVGARTAAMAYNRLVDRDVDARNPRTRGRHLPAGAVRVAEVVVLVVVSAAVFVVGAAALNPLALALSPIVLVVLLGYSHLKRFTALCHFGLGLALGLAPLGVWIAVRGVVDASAWIPATLGLAVICWVTGFDILYACQDVEFDRGAGLHSIPARLGVARSLWVARSLHVAMIAALIGLGVLTGSGPVYACGVALTAALLVYEHRLVRADDLSRIDVAFFTVNGCISLLLCAFTIAEQLA
ncbi:MAG: UbiA family prenyltransferase [Planctomycetes bacterium]|nr:UbiA family prenyltransferase [Planctomycetota bacterium]